ncbi:MAG: ATP-binding protein [Chloroflexota bacterium]
MPALRSALAPLGSASALSVRVGLIMLPLGVGYTLIGETAHYGGDPSAWAVAAVLGQLALLACLLGARRALCRAGDPDPLAVLGAFAVAGAARSLVFAAAAVLLGALDGIDLPYRLAGFAFNATVLAFIAWSVALHDRHHALVAQLEGARRQLTARERSLDAALARAEAELSGAVRASIEPALRALDRALASVTPGSGGDAIRADVERIIDEEVRPLSHRLAAEEPAAAIDDPVERRPSVRVPLPRVMRLADGFRPTLVATGFAVAAIPSAIRDLEPIALLPYLVVVWVCTFAWLATSRRLAGDRTVGIARAAALALGVHALAGGLLPLAIRSTGLPMPAGITPLAVGLAGVFAGATVVSSHLVSARRSRTENELRAVNAGLEQAVALIRRRRAIVRRRLAYVLHGSLQGALHAAAIRLGTAGVPDFALVASVRADVARAYARLGAEREREGVPLTLAALAEITGVWDGVRTLTSTVERGAETALMDDPDADGAVAEVIREAVNNAIRHGSARTVEIRVTPAPGGSGRPAALTVVVRDDGIGLGDPGRAGLGTRLFDEMCTWWRHHDTGRGTVFEAEIARG